MFCLQQYGGVSRYFYEIATRLARTQPVEVCAPFYITEYFGEGALRPRGVKVPALARSARIASKINALATWLLLRLRKDVDIFHETYYSLTDCAPSTRPKRVITVYDMIHERCAGTFAPDDRTRHVKAHAVRRADHVICISENTRRDLVELLQVPYERTSVVYLGYSLTNTHVSHVPNFERPYVLYVGQRNGYKNWQAVLQAFGQSRHLQRNFMLVCFGGGRLRSEELALIEKLRVHVVQLGGSDEVLAGLYSSASAFVYPSLYEGFGIPPLEAMSLGCPVVCSRTSSLPEVVGDAAQTFDPSHPEDITSALESVLSDSRLASSLIAKGRTRAQTFSWAKCADETLAVYHDVLGR